MHFFSFTLDGTAHAVLDSIVCILTESPFETGPDEADFVCT